ncbi:M14 metallopeptidase family protein [Alteromonas aestuariivivens]|nr:M14 metallopeptidase family protein [Alteromonas aestuariivivens]
MMALSAGHAHAASPLPQERGGKPIAEYLPENIQFDPSVPTPEAFLGANVGAWHIRHDQLVGYMQSLAESSPRVRIEETGRSHENRPLLLLTITAQSNQGKLVSMREKHLENIQTGDSPAATDPLVFYLGYSIHGNEPSGSNAAMVVAYYLAAAQGPEIEQLLRDNIVLLDPSFNPDGLARFAQWANMHKGKTLVADPEHREHKEGWPSGRTNHYWFDLNRDWLLLTHPESQARIRQFHHWRPHILTDHHEMGSNSSYFFQPGVRSRKNPLTPDGNVTLTEAIAKFHASAFDAAGQLYFTEEAFDDFYLGKGSTYPDAHGSIGILFEQASSRGHLQDTVNGPLAFEQTIQNHVTTSLSTLRGGLANKAAILEYQRQFVKETRALAAKDEYAGYLVSLDEDPGRFNALLTLLKQHQIQAQLLNRNFAQDGRSFEANKSIYVPLEQPQYRLIRSLFSTQKTFEDNTFYDVSNWNLALAFNAAYMPVSKRQGRSLATVAIPEDWLQPHSQPVNPGAYAYAFDWQHYYAPALLQGLLQAGVKVRSAGTGFTALLASGEEHQFSSGAIVIPGNLSQPGDLVTLLNQFSQALHIPVFEIKTGLTSAGIDLGSRQMVPVEQPKILLIGGPGTSQYEVGEIWHYLDTRVGLPVTIVDKDRLALIALSDYTHMIFASGSYDGLSEGALIDIGTWVTKGGVLIGHKSALRLFAKQDWLDIRVLKGSKIDEAFETENLKFADKDAYEANKIIAGAVYEAHIDVTHPLFYGFSGDKLPLFKTSNMVLKTDASPYIPAAYYTDEPLLAGFSAPELVSLIAGSTAAVAQIKGLGVVVGLVDNPMFRGYWYGTDKLLSNAIFQSGHIR